MKQRTVIDPAKKIHIKTPADMIVCRSFLLQDPEICGREGAAVLQPQNLRDSHEDQEMHRIECVKEIRMADISAGSVVP